MVELNFEQLIAAASKPEVASNLAQAATTAQKVTSTIETADKVLASVEKILDRLDRMGILPVVVRAAGKRYGVDPESPLKSRMGITATSPAHQQVITELNNMNEQQLGEIVTVLQQYYAAKKQQMIEAGSDGAETGNKA